MAAETTAGEIEMPTSSTGSTVPSPSTAPQRERSSALGSWVETVFKEDVFVTDVAVTEEGSFAALLTGRSNRFRVVESNEAGGWNPVTEWVRPPKQGFEFIDWFDLEVMDDGYVVTGEGRLEVRRGELDSIPVFSRLERATGEYELLVDLERPDGGWIVQSARFQDELIGVGQSGTDQQPWGPGIWASSDGLTWEPVDAPSEVQSVIFDLTSVAASSDFVVAVGRNNEGSEPPWVLWSPDGQEWEVALLPMVTEGERVRLAGVGYDGEEFVIAGVAEQRGEPALAATWRSADGANWDREAPPTSVFGDGNVDINGVWGSDGMVLLGGEGMHRTSHLYCYDDLETCRQPLSALWVRSEGAWQRVVSPNEDRAADVLATNGTRFVTTGSIGDVGAAWVWIPGAGNTQLYAAPLDTSPPQTDLPLVGLDRVVESDTTYAYPLYADCHGMGVLGEVNGAWWLLREGPTHPSANWPVFTEQNTIPSTQIVYGTIRLAAPDRIEYEIPGVGVIAEYEPAPSGYEPTFCF